MKEITQLDKLPKFLTIANDFPEFLSKAMKLKRGALVRVAPPAEQNLSGLRNYVRVYAKIEDEWKSVVLGWKHLSFLKK